MEGRRKDREGEGGRDEGNRELERVGRMTVEVRKSGKKIKKIIYIEMEHK